MPADRALHVVYVLMLRDFDGGVDHAVMRRKIDASLLDVDMRAHALKVHAREHYA